MTSRFVPPRASATALIPENKTDTFALLDAGWKLIYRDKAKQTHMNPVELYDRHTDRGDLTNVAAAHPQEVDQRMAEITKWIDAQTRLRNFLGRGAKSTLDQQTIEQLRSLGYLGGKQ